MTVKDGEKYVSFSEIKTYNECPFRWDLIYVKGNRQQETVHTVFGNAIHEAFDKKVKGNNLSWISMAKPIIKFIKKNPKDRWVKGDLDYKEWVRAAFGIYQEIFDWVARTFPNCDIIETEWRFKEIIKEKSDYKYKGFIDLVLKHKEKETYHIVDFKTTSWGWDKYKRSDVTRQYQVRLYKKFFCETRNIDPENVFVHFALLKRNPPKNKERCELITITSKQKAMENVSNWLTSNIKLLDKGMVYKKFDHCKLCEFNKTPLCP